MKPGEVTGETITDEEIRDLICDCNATHECIGHFETNTIARRALGSYQVLVNLTTRQRERAILAARERCADIFNALPKETP